MIKHKQISENGEIYTAGKNFTLPPAVTAVTNLTSDFHFGAPLQTTSFSRDALPVKHGLLVMAAKGEEASETPFVFN